MARRSRQLGGVVSLAQLAELREAITSGSFPKTVRYIDQTGSSLEAYAIDLAAVSLNATVSLLRDHPPAAFTWRGIRRA